MVIRSMIDKNNTNFTKQKRQGKGHIVRKHQFNIQKKLILNKNRNNPHFDYLPYCVPEKMCVFLDAK